MCKYILSFLFQISPPIGIDNDFQKTSRKNGSGKNSKKNSNLIFRTISIKAPLRIICLRHPFARYFAVSKYVVLDGEGYNNELLTI